MYKFIIVLTAFTLACSNSKNAAQEELAISSENEGPLRIDKDAHIMKEEGQSKTLKRDQSKSDSFESHRSIVPVDSLNIGDKTDFDFLSDCDSLEIWKGSIQGERHPSINCCYIMAQCFANKHYDVVVFSNTDIDLQTGSNFYENRIVDGLNNVQYLAFEIPKKEPQFPENEFDTYDYVYPSSVTVYQKLSDGWHVINIERVESFEQLGALKTKTLLHIDRPRKTVITNPTIDTARLFKIWTLDPNAPQADFRFTQTEFFVADHDGDGAMPYLLNKDSLTIFYSDFVKTGRIVSVSKDTLKIEWNGSHGPAEYVEWNN